MMMFRRWYGKSDAPDVTLLEARISDHVRVNLALRFILGLGFESLRGGL